MEFRILGSLEIVEDGRTVPALAPRLSTLLAVLLLRPRQVISVEELAERLWQDEQRPVKPTAALHTYIRRLRSIVGSELLKTQRRGYLLDAEPADVAEFRQLTSQAATASEPGARVDLLRRALGLWRGEPLNGVAGVSAAQHVVAGLIEERLLALEELFEARLELGEHLQVLPELTTLSTEHLLRDRFHHQLMRAQHQAGRQAEALATYDAVAARLADEYGLDPSDELRELRQLILTGRPRDGWVPQYQLPLDTQYLVGRDELVKRLERVVGSGGRVPVVVLSGTPGVGKTALAVRAGHNLRREFPDGQWFVRLRGASGQPRKPDDVLAELLLLTGVEPLVIPDDRDARAALLRSKLAGRRVLLILDDARDAGQVRPLLPGAVGNAVLITSRSRLEGLIALDGAVGLQVDTLEPADSGSLVSLLIGRPGEPAAVEDLVAMCDGLPLALRIAAANAAAADESLDSYVRRMRAAGPLSMLSIADDEDSAVTAAFFASYDLLDPVYQRGFRLLSIFPGVEFGRGAAEALLGGDPSQVLLRLEQASLLQSPRSDRYLMHDLVKQYGAQLASQDPEVRESWSGLSTWYLRQADAAVEALFPTAVRLVRPPNPYVLDRDTAERWLETELANIESIAVEAGESDTAWLLADIVRPYLYHHGLMSPWRRLAEIGLSAAEAAGDTLGRGAMEHAHAILARVAGDPERAIEHNQVAIPLYRDGGFQLGAAALLCNLGLAYNDQGRLRRGSEALAEGIQLLREAGEQERLPVALLNQSLNHLHLGQFDAAISTATEAIEIGSATGHHTVAIARTNLAAAYRSLGDHARAMRELRAARPATQPLDLIAWRQLMSALLSKSGDRAGALREAELGLRESLEIGSAYHEALSRLHLGEVYLWDGDNETARTYFEQAEALAAGAGHGTLHADAQRNLGVCAYRRGEFELACELGRAALAELRRIEHVPGIADAERLLAACCRALGRETEAARHQDEADRLMAETGYCGIDQPL